jgi:DNA/RNA endonuclease G (NUC1)
MQLTKTQRFGLISFFVLIIAAYLVTTEPWKKDGRQVQTSVNPENPPMNITIAWDHLSIGYPLALTTDTILSYAGFDLAYNEQYEQAAWVAYVLTREEIESGNIGRNG